MIKEVKKVNFMEFKLKKGIPSVIKGNNGCDMHWNPSHLTEEQRDMIRNMANAMSETTYHEICHQLNGTKMEFNGEDDGEVHIASKNLHFRREYVLASAMYRGILGGVLCELGALKEAEEERKEEQELEEQDLNPDYDPAMDTYDDYERYYGRKRDN